MRIVSAATMWLGILVALVGVGASVWGGWIAYRQFLALDALRSAPADKPVLQLVIAAVALLLGGFLLGLGVGIRPKPAVATSAGTTPVS